jgi:hypothetical protein
MFWLKKKKSKKKVNPKANVKSEEDTAKAMAENLSRKMELEISKITNSKLGRCGNVF